jgi:glutathionylspermidine synthase
MILERFTPRSHWRTQFEELGFLFHSIDGVYWDETRAYRFTPQQIDVFEEATETLHTIALQAAHTVISSDAWLTRFAIPQAVWPWIRASWNDGKNTNHINGFSLFGRFDFSWDGNGAPKMLEYNADTSTALPETSIAQWAWLQDVRKDADQFNSLHEKLIERWQQYKTLAPFSTLHFACADSEEDWGNLEYLRDTAAQAGWQTKALLVDDIGVQTGQFATQFTGKDDERMDACVKLYPWEWMVREEFAAYLPTSTTRWIEPPWKMVLSNKAILPVMWALYPDCPYLLPAGFTPQEIKGDFVRKPFLSREGANVSLIRDGHAWSEDGPYGSEGYIYQAAAPLPMYEGAYTCIGSWVVGDKAAGIGIREDESPITKNTSRFVPHYFDD